MRKYLILFASAILLSGCTLPSFLKKQAGLQVRISGEDRAAVLLNDANVGDTPYKADTLKPGEYTLRLEPQDASKAAYETHLKLTSGLVTLVNWSFGKTLEESGGEIFELTKISSGKRAELSVMTSPDNIVIRVDGVSRGFSPHIFEDLSEGEHTLTLSAPGYVERTMSPSLRKGYRIVVTAKLPREAQSLSITTDQSTPSGQITPTPKPTPKPSPTPKTGTATGSATIKTSVTPPLPYVEVTQTPTGWLRVRAEASGSADEVAKLDVGAKVPYLGETVSGWHKVEYATGKQGWVSGQYAVVHSQ